MAETGGNKGTDLKSQRFQMLEDIALDLYGNEFSFPTCFDAALRIRDVLRKNSASLREIAHEVAMEPLVVSRLLRMANSVSQSTGSKQITEVEAAIGRLGLEMSRSVAFAVAMDQLLRSKDLVVFGDVPRQVWMHSLHTAAAARVLARKFTHQSVDDAFIAGLVHDLGAFYLLYRAAQYEELRARPETVKHLIAEWHESIGESLLGALGLPECVIVATHEHDQPRPSVLSPHTLTDVVYVANLLSGGPAGQGWAESERGSPPEELRHAPYQALAGQIEAEYQALSGCLA